MQSFPLFLSHSQINLPLCVGFDAFGVIKLTSSCVAWHQDNRLIATTKDELIGQQMCASHSHKISFTSKSVNCRVSINLQFVLFDWKSKIWRRAKRTFVRCFDSFPHASNIRHTKPKFGSKLTLKWLEGNGNKMKSKSDKRRHYSSSLSIFCERQQKLFLAIRWRLLRRRRCHQFYPFDDELFLRIQLQTHWIFYFCSNFCPCLTVSFADAIKNDKGIVTAKLCKNTKRRNGDKCCHLATLDTTAPCQISNRFVATKFCVPLCSVETYSIVCFPVSFFLSFSFFFSYFFNCRRLFELRSASYYSVVFFVV